MSESSAAVNECEQKNSVKERAGYEQYALAHAALQAVRQAARASEENSVKREYSKYPNSLPFESTVVAVDEPNGLWDVFKYKEGVLCWKGDKVPLRGVVEGFCQEDISVAKIVYAMHNTFVGMDVNEQPLLAALVVGHYDGNPENCHHNNLYLVDIEQRLEV